MTRKPRVGWLPGSSVWPAFVVCVLAVTVSGCGVLKKIGDPGVDGFGQEDEALRRLLITSSHDAALKQVRASAARDEVLRLLEEGVVAHYAGLYEESSAALERAMELAEDRAHTSSVSRAAASVLTNDLSLAYEPLEVERLLIHYYDAMNYLRRGMIDDAAVEARRLSALLDEYGHEGDTRAAAAVPMMRSFAAAVFAAAGERNDAEVALRLGGDTTMALPFGDRDSGLVVVMVEQGFVPHRVEQSLNVFISGAEMAVFGDDDFDARTNTAAAISARVLAEAFRGPLLYDRDSRPRSIFVDFPRQQVAASTKEECESSSAARRAAQTTRAARRRPPVKHPADTTRVAAAEAVVEAEAQPASLVEESSSASKDAECKEKKEENPYLLRVAWPVYMRGPYVAPATVVTADSVETAFRLRTDVGAAVIADFDMRRGLALTRTVARAAAKLALTKQVEKGLDGKSEGLGRLVGLLANAGTAALERADTRSWHLLPGSIGLTTLRLPAGSHALALRVGAGEAARTQPLDSVSVRPGGVTIVSTRAWQ